MDTGTFLLERESLIERMRLRRVVSLGAHQNGNDTATVSWQSLVPWKTLTGIAFAMARHKLLSPSVGPSLLTTGLAWAGSKFISRKKPLRFFGK